MITAILRNKFAFLGGAFLGTLIGTFFPEIGRNMGYVSDILIDVMKMCVMPIILTSITISSAHFTTEKSGQATMPIILSGFCVLLICSMMGMIAAVLFQPGFALDTTTSPLIKNVVEASAQSTRAINESFDSDLTSGTLNILLSLIPNNIYAALAENRILQVISFAIILGVSLGHHAKEDAKILVLMQQTLDIFSKIFSVIAFIFPIIMVCISAKHSAELGSDMFITMGKFILEFYAATTFLFVVLSLIMFVRTKTSFSQWYNIIKDPLIVAIATQSSVASIPTSINAMKRFNYDPKFVQLIIPLGSLIGRYGVILYFGFCAIFATQIYSLELSWSDYVLIMFVAVLAGVSTSGQSSTLGLSSLSLILTPLGIPFESIQPLLIAVDAFVDPARSFTIVHTSCVIVSLVDQPRGKPLSLEEVFAAEQVPIKASGGTVKNVV